jgi:hypothetical protein
LSTQDGVTGVAVGVAVESAVAVSVGAPVGVADAAGVPVAVWLGARVVDAVAVGSDVGAVLGTRLGELEGSGVLVADTAVAVAAAPLPPPQADTTAPIPARPRPCNASLRVTADFTRIPRPPNPESVIPEFACWRNQDARRRRVDGRSRG